MTPPTEVGSFRAGDAVTFPETGNPNHRDMSLLHWRELLQQTQD